MQHRTFVSILALLLAVEFAILAVAPVSRATWWLENVLSIAAVVLLAATHRRFPLSRISYGSIFAFLALHEVGAHYTYSEVPYDAAWRALFGFSLQDSFGWERNHFDRAVHLAYGLLLAYPIREIYVRIVAVRGIWSYVLPLGFTMSTSMLYELIEWGAAELFGGELGMAYLGTQGDVWDAHKDMALASFGALLVMAATLAINLALQRDFAREWAESLRVKNPTPLGEVALARMLERRETTD